MTSSVSQVSASTGNAVIDNAVRKKRRGNSMAGMVVANTPVVSTVAPYFDKTKGNPGNKIECSAAQTWNTVKTTGGILTLGGAAALITNKVKKAPEGKLANFIKGADKMFGETSKKIGTRKLTDFYRSIPKSVKRIALPLVGLVALAGVFKSGKIDQKYTDKAEVIRNNTLIG